MKARRFAVGFQCQGIIVSLAVSAQAFMFGHLLMHHESFTMFVKTGDASELSWQMLESIFSMIEAAVAVRSADGSSRTNACLLELRSNMRTELLTELATSIMPGDK